MRIGSAIFSLSSFEDDHRENVTFHKFKVLESVREQFRYLQDESNEPLLTILVLVTGVAGGLTAVIGVVYIYVRFCAKRSEKGTDAEAAGKWPPSRPPLPSTLLPYANAQQPIYQHFLPPISEVEPPKSILEDLANDTKKIAQVFPLINKSPPVPPSAPETAPLTEAPKSRHLSSATEKSISTSQSTLRSTASSRRNTVASGARRGTMPSRRRGTTLTAQQRAAATDSRRSVKVRNEEVGELQPLKIPEYRADAMILTQAERRPSEMVPQRRPGTGRRLPSIDHLPPPSPAFQVHVNVPQIRTPVDNAGVRHGQVSPSQRRASYLVRSVAIDDTLPPRKQTSSPLPQHAQRIYERDHVHSRSWNAEGYRYDVREPIAEDPYARNVPPSMQPRPSSSRLLRPLVPYPPSGVAMVATGQTRIVDDRPPMRPLAYSPSMNPPPREVPRYSPRRARSESIRNTLVRQRAAAAQPDLEVDERCHGLWSERGRLEHSALRNVRPLPPRMVSRQFSADASDELSTSFESNWGPPPGSRGPLIQGGRSDRIRPCPPAVRWNDERGTEAALRRQKYRDLLIQRNMPSRSIHPETSSFESTSEATALQPTASSMESSNFSALEGLPTSSSTRLQMHNGHVENMYGRKPSVMPRNVSRAKSLWRKVPHVVHATFRRDARSCEMRRDYSVDAQTDQIFREFARVDPKYEPSPKTSDASTYRSPTPRGSKWPRWSSDVSQNRSGWFP